MAAGPGDTTTTRSVALTQPQAVKGLGGIGKTQIAVEFAYRACDLDSYTHILWINAANEETIIASFVALAELLPAFSAKGERDQQKLIQAIKRWLERCEYSWLLIFDNADDLSLVHTYLPRQGNGSILLTTRANATGTVARSIEVESMALMEGTTFLLHRAQRLDHASDEEINEAINIVILLGRFPLALDQAGAYIEETGCALDDYLQVYQTRRKELLARRGLQTTHYPDSVATTWSLSFQKVEQANPAAAELLHLCAFLAPDKIPEELIRDGATQWSPALQQAAVDPFTFNQMMADLLKFSLVERLAETRTFSIHRLVQAVQRDMMEPEVQSQWAERVVRAVNEVFPAHPQDTALWSQCLRYLDQAQACDTLIAQYMLRFTDAASILHRTGWYLNQRAFYTIAEPLWRSALAIWEHQLGPQHPVVASVLNNLANLHKVQGKYTEAEGLYERARTIWEQELGPDHPEVGTLLNNLASLYSEQGKYAEAEPLFQRALHIKEQQLGLEHPDVARLLNGLAGICQVQGKYAEAEPLYQRALHIKEQQLGPDHPEVGTPLNNLARLYSEQGKYSQAEPLYQRALRIREQHLGPENPLVAYSLAGLAELYSEQGKYAEAELLFQRALQIWERHFGPAHPLVASPLNGLANLFREQGKYEQAEEFYRRALQIYEQTLGDEHLDVASPLNGLANLFCEQGKYEQAEEFYQRALQIYEQALVTDHPLVAQTLHELATLYAQQRKYEQASVLYQRALAIRQLRLEPGHPDIIRTRKRYAALLRAMDRAEEAALVEASLPEMTNTEEGPEA